MTETPQSPPSARQILAATGAALAVAVVLLFAAVLPAEYGIDPLGSGRALGLVRAPASVPEEKPLTPKSDADLKVDAVELEIAPYDYVEYKYRLAQSAAMLFSWESSAAVIELDQKNNVLKMTTRDKGYPPVVEIDITPKTRIERDGRPTPRTALNRGVHVVVDALGDDVFSLEALTIRIVPAPK